MAGKAATDFDTRLGERILKFRVDANVSRRVAAKALCVSQAQLQKYEAGTNCLKASALPILASLLGRDIRDFFDSNLGDGAPVCGKSESMTKSNDIDLVTQEAINQLDRAVSDVKTVIAEISQKVNPILNAERSKRTS